jgi:hypothetical protein
MKCAVCENAATMWCGTCVCTEYCSSACREADREAHESAAPLYNGRVVYRDVVYRVETYNTATALVCEVYFPGATDHNPTLKMKANDGSAFEIVSFFRDCNAIEMQPHDITLGWLGVGILSRMACSIDPAPTLGLVDEWISQKMFSPAIPGVVSELLAHPDLFETVPTRINGDNRNAGTFFFDCHLTSCGLAFFCNLTHGAYRVLRSKFYDPDFFTFIDWCRADTYCADVAQHGYYGQFGFTRGANNRVTMPAWVCGPDVSMDFSDAPVDVPFVLPPDTVAAIRDDEVVTYSAGGVTLRSLPNRLELDVGGGVIWIETFDWVTFHVTFPVSVGVYTEVVDDVIAALADDEFTIRVHDTWQSEIGMPAWEWDVLVEAVMVQMGDVEPGTPERFIIRNTLFVPRLLVVQDFDSQMHLNSSGLQALCSLTDADFAAVQDVADSNIMGFVKAVRLQPTVEAVIAYGYYGQFGYVGTGAVKQKGSLPAIALGAALNVVSAIPLSAALIGKEMIFTEAEAASLRNLFSPASKVITAKFSYKCTDTDFVAVEMTSMVQSPGINPWIEIIFTFPRSDGLPVDGDDIRVTTKSMTEFHIESFFFDSKRPEQIVPASNLGNYGFASVVSVIRALQKLQTEPTGFVLSLDDCWTLPLDLEATDMAILTRKHAVLREEEPITFYNMISNFRERVHEPGMFVLTSRGLQNFCKMTESRYAYYAADLESDVLRGLFKVLSKYRDGPYREAIAKVGYYGKFMFYGVPGDMRRDYDVLGRSMHEGHELPPAAAAAHVSDIIDRSDNGELILFDISVDDSITVTAEVGDDVGEADGTFVLDEGPVESSTPKRNPRAMGGDLQLSAENIKTIRAARNSAASMVSHFYIDIHTIVVKVMLIKFSKSGLMEISIEFPRKGGRRKDVVIHKVEGRVYVIRAFSVDGVVPLPGVDMGWLAMKLATSIIAVVAGYYQMYRIHIFDTWNSRFWLKSDTIGESLDGAFDIREGKAYLNSAGLKKFCSMTPDEFEHFTFAGAHAMVLKSALVAFRASRDVFKIAEYGYYGQFDFATDPSGRNPKELSRKVVAVYRDSDSVCISDE